MTAHTPDALASALPAGKYVVAPAPTGYRGSALWTVTADGQLGEMVATEPQDHGPGSTAVVDLKHALAVYRAACAVLAPTEETVTLLAEAMHDRLRWASMHWSTQHLDREAAPHLVTAMLAALGAAAPAEEDGEVAST